MAKFSKPAGNKPAARPRPKTGGKSKSGSGTGGKRSNAWQRYTSSNAPIPF